MATVKHPLDFDALRKGTWLEVGELEEATRVRASSPSYRFELMKLIELIYARTGILCRQDGQRLRLMVDSEARIWNVQQFANHERGMVKSLRRATEAIDVGALTEQEQRAHEHSTMLMGAIVASGQAAKRKLKRQLAGEMPPELRDEYVDEQPDSETPEK